MASEKSIPGLADRTTSLVGWTIAWRATSAVATLALGAVLVRQLPTSEYGRYTLVLQGLERFRIVSEDRTCPYRRGQRY